ncbi:sensor domain-containing protein [Streptomyces sp. NPDC046976]|uniref:sensor domain-containing protein n=1 Tax=Streptomyces sp. NPDC046976 TaxID=3155258 RepID=UPI0033C826AC
MDLLRAGRAGRVVCAAAFVLSVGALSACGGGSGGSSAGTARTSEPSVSASPSAPAAHAKPLTEGRLKAAVITAADVPGLRADTSEDGSGAETQRITATSGGPVCTQFLNAMSAYAGTYGSSAAVVRGFTVQGSDGPVSILVSLVSHTSAAGAQRVIDDARKSAKGCAHLTYDNGGSTRMNLAPLALPVMGDDSTVTRAGVIIGKRGFCMVMGLVRVGTVSLNVMVSSDGYDYGDLQTVAKVSVGKLKKVDPQVASAAS